MQKVDENKLQLYKVILQLVFGFINQKTPLKPSAAGGVYRIYSANVFQNNFREQCGSVL
jgi:hypothetical protein